MLIILNVISCYYDVIMAKNPTNKQKIVKLLVVTKSERLQVNTNLNYIITTKSEKFFYILTKKLF